MISITKATERDRHTIADIGRVAVAASHKGSSPDEVMNAFLERNYNSEAVKEELSDPNNIYYIIKYRNQTAGFSKVIMNVKHPNITAENLAKLDRIYLLKEFYGMKLGLELLNFNIELCEINEQSGIWLYAWVGNERAVNFYLKAGFEVIGEHKFYVTETHYDVSHQMLLRFCEVK